MSNYYSDPTASAATGTVDRELRQMKKRARQIGRQHRLGLLSPEELARAARPFTGIYRRFLLEALSPRKKANRDTPQGCPLSFAAVPECSGSAPEFHRRFWYQNKGHTVFSLFTARHYTVNIYKESIPATNQHKEDFP